MSLDGIFNTEFFLQTSEGGTWEATEGYNISSEGFILYEVPEAERTLGEQGLFYGVFRFVLPWTC